MEENINYSQPMYGERPMPSMIEATKTCLRKYAVFSGRARRSEYWWFMLAQYLIAMALSFLMVIVMIVQLVIGVSNGSITEENGFYFMFKNPVFWIYCLYSLALIIPNLSVMVRRLHDIGKSGWYLLLPFLSPILVGGAVVLAIFNHDLWFFMIVAYVITLAIMIIMLVWMATNGKKETNKWGPSPKYFPIEQNS